MLRTNKLLDSNDCLESKLQYPVDGEIDHGLSLKGGILEQDTLFLSVFALITPICIYPVADNKDFRTHPETLLY